MGIYIAGMEIPKGCATCPYYERDWNKPKCKAKSMQGRFMEQKLNLDRTRQKWCPLIPIPAHGRLIDADAVEEALWRVRRHYQLLDDTQTADKIMQGLYRAEHLLDDAPVVIPADKEDDDG